MTTRRQCVPWRRLARPSLPLIATACLLSAGAASARPEVTIEEWPTDLRTDLRGTSVTIALPENAPDRIWNDALTRKFTELTGIEVRILRPGADMTAVLASYLRDLDSGSPGADVYAIDVVWPALFADRAEDLKPVFGDLREMLPELVRNDTLDGRLVAVPYFVEVSLLYYRTDLLEKYGFERPPRTWTELEAMARTISRGERAGGNTGFWGFLWQGAASEALTCNALEWQLSEGGGRLVGDDGRVTIDRARLVRAIERARCWVGTLSPPDVTSHLEDDSLRIWERGDAAFMRNWPYAYVAGAKANPEMRDHVGVTLLPMGEGSGARHADTLGGFQLMVSKTSGNRAGAIELVRFLTSAEIQRVNATARGYAPTRRVLYDDPAVLAASPLLGSLKGVLLGGAVTRPSTAAGSRYDELSAAYVAAVRGALLGTRSAAAAVAELDERLRRMFRANRAHGARARIAHPKRTYPFGKPAGERP